MRYYTFQNETKAYLNRLERENGLRISGVSAKALNDRVEALKKSGVWTRYALGFNDVDGDAYLARANVTNVMGRGEVLWFIRGMKALGLYSNMVAWPMRSYQNAGTGSTVYSLGGLGRYDGTMINSPTWGYNGVAFTPDITKSIAYDTSLYLRLRTDCSIMGVINKHGQDNFRVFKCQRSNVAPYDFYPTLTSNDNTVSQVCIPVITRNSSHYYISDRGGVTPSGNTCISASFFSSSQSSYKNGTLIKLDTGLAAPNPQQVPNEVNSGGGNVRIGTAIMPINMVINLGLQPNGHSSLYLLYKQTLGTGLGLI